MRIHNKIAICLFMGALTMVSLSCTKHEIETRSKVEVAPIEVKPIHITIDVNLRVERALDDVFKDIDEAQAGEAQEKGGKSGKE